jgi:penicillin-binding protein 1C
MGEELLFHENRFLTQTSSSRKATIFMNVCFKKTFLRIGVSLFAIMASAAVFWACARFWPMDVSHYLASESSPVIRDRDGKLLYAFLNKEEQWRYDEPLSALGARISAATLAAEDRRFCWHLGVDPVAIIRAAWLNVKGRRIISGGSTITMQLVRLKDGRRRTLFGKTLQAWRAFCLERKADKDDVLAAYLNSAPYGGNITGVEAASRIYFGKSARELTISEAALLAAIPKSPNKLSPLAHSKPALNRRNYVLRRMLDEGLLDDDEYRRSVSEPLGVERRARPELAPHLAMSLKTQRMNKADSAVTLDADIQENAEGIVSRYMKRFAGEIDNAAVVVVDVKTATFLSRVGSMDFFGSSCGGQMDACRALRAPGSALKPFTYALAMEMNQLYSTESLLDEDIDYGEYRPKNYDGDYNGLISASDALRHSLNVPAVMVLNRIGPASLLSLLRNVGLLSLKKSPDEYGLALTLGDCEVRLEELAGAYCMLANLGEYKPLCVTPDKQNEVASTRLLNRGVCLKIYEMLEQPLPDEWDSNMIRPDAETRVCWKTGTSTGHRDAWAFVFNREYVVGVWLGNNNGKASERLVGIHAALPLAARLFRALPVSEESSWPNVGEELRSVEVCAVSGLPASRWCERTKEAFLPREQYLNRICDVHCPSGERWPGGAKGWDLAKVGARLPMDSMRKEVLAIREPANSAEYVITGESEGDKICLKSSLDSEADLNWYLDEAYLGRSTPASPLIMDLKPGNHILACMAPDGALDKVRFNVARPDSGHKTFKE